VNAPEEFKQFGLKRLHADTDAIDAGIVVAEEFIAVNGSGIGFQSDLTVGFNGKRRRTPSEELADALRLERRWCAAAKKNALRRTAAPFLRVAIACQFGEQRIHIGLFGNFGDDM